ncbi:MAG: hypothetical protein AAGA68_22660 [Pseudomonadota bacterium]
MPPYARHACALRSLLLLCPLLSTALAQAPDPSTPGPYATARGEYRLDAEIDPLVLEGQFTEVWAETYYPLGSTGPIPVVAFMPGNRPTCGSGSEPRFDTNCDYTETGICPDGFVVTPSHQGFDYAAEPLAAWGYVAVSINTNRGISCGSAGADDLGLNKARGRMFLRHLQRLSEWNAGLIELPGGFPEELRGRLDFQQVGLVGHSRGGEGARAAYNFYSDSSTGWQERIPASVSVKAIFEIGAVDGQTDTTFDAAGTAWAQLLPMCDGDVFTLEGVRPLDRMVGAGAERPPRMKASFAVWGANHNFFNSAWETSEISGCVDQTPLFPDIMGSAEQQQIGRATILALMRGTLGPDARADFLRNFNPAYAPPAVIGEVTRVDRGFVDAPNRRLEVVFEDFSQPTGTNRYGFANDAKGITLEHREVPGHDLDQRAARISWNGASPEAYLQVNWTSPGAGRDVSRRRTISFRVARQFQQLDYLSSTDFTVALVNADGSLSSSRRLSDYLDLTGPVGTLFRRHEIMQSVRLPMSDFTGADLSNLRGVRFTFDVANPGLSDDDGGAIHLSNVQFAARMDRATQPAKVQFPEPTQRAALSSTPPQARFSGRLGSVREVQRSVQLGREAVEIDIVSEGVFPVTDALPTLSIAGLTSRVSRYSSDTKRLTFVLSRDEFRSLDATADVVLQIGAMGRQNLGPLAQASQHTKR